MQSDFVKTDQIQIYLPESSARLLYGMEIVFTHLLGLKPIILSTINESIDSSIPLLCIKKILENSQNPSSDASEIITTNAPNLLLDAWIFQSDIDSTFIPSHSLFNNLPILFAFDNKAKQSLLSFDIFSASVYLLSRYEEYVSVNRDDWGRYTAKQSILYKLGVLHRPIVNLWSLELMKILHMQFPQLIFNLPKYQCLPTLDVDQVYAFRHKSFFIQTAAFAKDIFKSLASPSQENMLPYRWTYYMRKQKDPFDNLLFWANFFKKNNLPACFFILMGNYGGVDKSNPSKIKEFQKNLQTISMFENISIGIHFSVKSNRQTRLQAKEISDLRNIYPKSVERNRQHFLILNFPQTYRELLMHNIKEDYTMGYADLPGFRAGIAIPFPYFDLGKNEKTELVVYPFAFMDGTYRKYMQCDYANTLSSMKTFVDEIRAVGGTFTCLFHNESLTDTPPWKGWRDLYMNLIQYAK